MPFRSFGMPIINLLVYTIFTLMSATAFSVVPVVAQDESLAHRQVIPHFTFRDNNWQTFLTLFNPGTTSGLLNTDETDVAYFQTFQETKAMAGLPAGAKKARRLLERIRESHGPRR
ncbi:hypothetical protein SCOR_18565 [Sulfidibacter corallicola]|uniref:Uncharacterized protein n=1 Tax=Sulfidibacter corallicola TaxID=2818388 RepID=A0A8A4TW13_SULCO|nr:hypothetical protein [Sulfidibacter corallicola]QTD53547.1 hypothetical protein J3U87_13915 [Sulfidibacter corallicola]